VYLLLKKREIETKKMSDKIRLSHSAIERYLLCSERYRLHYIEGYRTQTIGSALFFGSAYGNAVQEMAKEGLTLDQAKERFDKYFKTTEINSEKVDLENTEKARYFKGDLKIEYVPLDIIIDSSGVRMAICPIIKINKQEVTNEIRWRNARRVFKKGGDQG
jgi:hypothetical protein